MAKGAGARRHLVRVERIIETQDAQGSPIVTHQRIATKRASLTPIRGRVSDDQASHNIRMTYLPGVMAETHRCVLGARVFSILSVAILNEIKREIEFVVRENI